MPYILNIQLSIDMPGAPTMAIPIGETFKLRVKFDTVTQPSSHSWPTADSVAVDVPSTEHPPTRYKVLLSYDELAPMGIRYSRPHLIRMEAKGQFPKRVLLSPGRIAWRKSDIEAWIANR